MSNTANPSNTKGIILLISTVILAAITPFIVSKIIFRTPYLINEAEPFLVENYSGICHLPSDAEEQQQIKDLGATWGRIDISWDRIQTNATTWDYSSYDARIAEAQANGNLICGLLNFDNEAVETIDSEYQRYIHPDDLPLFLEYVNRTIRRYIDAIPLWEVWNEPNIPNFWDGPYSDFYILMELTGQMIHSIEKELGRDIRVLAPSITGGVAGYVPMLQEEFFKKDLMTYYDGINFHVYQYDAESLQRSILQFKSIGKKYNFTGEYWITEIGNPTDGDYAWQGTPEKVADNLLKTYALSVTMNLDGVIWYTYRDSAGSSWYASEAYFGLIYYNNTWKPSAYAFSLFNRLCVGKEFQPNLINTHGIAKEDYIFIAFRGAENQISLIYWYKPLINSDQGTFSLDSSAILGDIHQYNIYSGENSTILGKNIPITSHPQILTFQLTEPSATIEIDTSTPIMFYFIYGGLIGCLGIAGSLVFRYQKKISSIKEK